MGCTAGRSNCCCDRCDEVRLHCDRCCKCVPRRLCVQPGTDDCECSGGLTRDDETGIYSGTITCVQQPYDVETEYEATAEVGQDEYGECRWLVTISGGDYGEEELEFPFENYGGTGRADCRRPSLDISSVVECPVSLVADESILLPLVKPDPYQHCKEYFCGNCRCICDELCVTFSGYGVFCSGLLSAYGDTPEDETGSVTWSGELDCGDDITKSASVTLYRDEYTGECLADVSVEGAGTHTVEINQCGDDFHFSIDDYDVEITGSCATCGSCEVDECPDVCVSHGESFGPCGGSYALFYFLGQLLEIPQEDVACFDIPTTALIRDAEECKWCDDTGQWCFEPGSITYTDGDDTWVWEPVGTFDPLCTSRWQLVSSPDGSTCTPHDPLCLTPANGCCDNRDFRDSVLPDTLHVAGEHCCNAPGEDPVSFEFDINWNADEGRWEGSTSICNATLDLRLTCICGVTEGCGDDETPCYQATILSDGCLAGSGGSITTCSCNPFEIEATFTDIFTNCCPAENLIDLDLVITE